MTVDPEQLLKRYGLREDAFRGLSVIPHNFKDIHIFDASTMPYRGLENWRKCKDTEDESDAIMRYLIYMYEPNTPLLKGFTDLSKRIDVAIELSGMEDKHLRSMIKQNKMIIVKRMAFELLKHSKNMLWNLIISNEAIFFEAMDNLLNESTETKDKDLVQTLKYKDDLAVKMDKANDRLEKYKRQFYGGDDRLADNHAQISKMSSESIALKMSRE